MRTVSVAVASALCMKIVARWNAWPMASIRSISLTPTETMGFPSTPYTVGMLFRPPCNLSQAQSGVLLYPDPPKKKGGKERDGKVRRAGGEGGPPAPEGVPFLTPPARPGAPS